MQKERFPLFTVFLLKLSMLHVSITFVAFPPFMFRSQNCMSNVKLWTFERCSAQIVQRCTEQKLGPFWPVDQTATGPQDGLVLLAPERDVRTTECGPVWPSHGHPRGIGVEQIQS